MGWGTQKTKCLLNWRWNWRKVRNHKLIASLVLFCGLVMAPRIAQADLLRIHAIAPPEPMDWSSPKGLLTTTILNSFRSTYAPNGHVLIHLITPKIDVMTSMASKKKGQTFGVTVVERLGLSALYHDFEGKLDSAEFSQRLLEKARRDGRLATIEIEIDAQTSQEMLDFLHQWIQSGAYQHYRGGQIASALQGAGCADFVMWFLHRATQGRAPLQSWVRELWLPFDLLQETSPARILKREFWAQPGEGRFFMIPDPELLYQWIHRHTQSLDLNHVSPEPTAILRLKQSEFERYFPIASQHFSAELISRTPAEPIGEAVDEATTRAVWESILIVRPRSKESRQSDQTHAEAAGGA